MSKACKTAGYSGAFRLTTAFESYRLSVLYNWIYVTVVAGTLDVSNPTAFAWMAQMVARQSAASDDLGCFDLLKSVMA